MVRFQHTADWTQRHAGNYTFMMEEGKESFLSVEITEDFTFLLTTF